MTNIFNLFLIFLFSFLLVKATDILIFNFTSLSYKTRLRKFALTGLILGLTTSLPELFIGLSAAFEGEPILSLGNIVGANIANLSLVIGGAALIGGAIFIHGSFLRRDVFYAFLAAVSPMLLLSDKALSRIDGLILLVLYGFYQMAVFSEREDKEEKKEEEQGRLLLKKFGFKKRQKELAWIFLGIALLLFSADFLVKISVKLALAFNLPLLLVGILIVALGTTLPELVFGIRAIQEKQPSMLLGNLLGSIVANGTFIIGLVALISPFRLQSLNSYFLSTMAFLVIFGLFFLLSHTKKRLDRWEGMILLLIYLIFIIIQFYSS